ncbi:uncharacterized protein LOC117782632 isoform X3 [Drosophila innubila]|uniref:uncharacterized protein LOC117782632 isoform X3 n=1 Tax=Drosophila innubila TaxID=198719 RepID=UPI00148DD50D|nr:uncharacterized protein LOC117782632 isoform X3 [Drosophila innubila]
MNKLFIFLLFLRYLECSGNRCAYTSKPLRMTVLYESLCEDSQEFLKNLWPVFQEYHQCINLTLVPHGKSTVIPSAFQMVSSVNTDVRSAGEIGCRIALYTQI